MRRTMVCGEQRAWVEAPDLLCIRLAGTLDSEELNEVLAWVNAFAEGKRHLYTLCDLSALQGLSPNARRALSEYCDPGALITSVGWGAGFSLRVVLSMLGRARMLLGLGWSGGIPQFFATEAEARNFIEQDRKRKMAAA